MFSTLALVMFEPGIIITLVLSCIGAVVWAVRIEGRVNGHDKSFVDLKELLDERDEHIKERYSEIAGKLIRIEHKIDSGFEKGMKA